jgi:hypothetical protein
VHGVQRRALHVPACSVRIISADAGMRNRRRSVLRPGLLFIYVRPIIASSIRAIAPN